MESLRNQVLEMIREFDAWGGGVVCQQGSRIFVLPYNAPRDGRHGHLDVLFEIESLDDLDATNPNDAGELADIVLQQIEDYRV